jgi:hypothetical protein
LNGAGTRTWATITGNKDRWQFDQVNNVNNNQTKSMNQKATTPKTSTSQSEVTMPPASEKRFLSLGEDCRVLRALSKGLGRCHSKEEALRVLGWADETRFRVCVLQLALEGLVSISFKSDGELRFDAIPPESMEPSALKEFRKIVDGQAERFN